MCPISCCQNLQNLQPSAAVAVPCRVCLAGVQFAAISSAPDLRPLLAVTSCSRQLAQSSFRQLVLSLHSSLLEA